MVKRNFNSLDAFITRAQEKTEMDSGSSPFQFEWSKQIWLKRTMMKNIYVFTLHAVHSTLTIRPYLRKYSRFTIKCSLNKIDLKFSPTHSSPPEINKFKI